MLSASSQEEEEEENETEEGNEASHSAQIPTFFF